MNNIRLKNFRNIDDTGIIRLRPLTILVGKNGMGKSSLMRFFPLLKQSVAVSKRGPLLWYSDKGVDFGDFRSVVKNGRNNIEIGFSINYGMGTNSPFAIDLNLTIVPEKQDSKPDEISYDFVECLNMNFTGNKISIQFDKKSDDNDSSSVARVLINGNYYGEVNYEYFMSGIFPVIINGNEDNSIPGFKELKNLLTGNRKFKFTEPSDFIGISFEDFKNMIIGNEYGYSIKTVYERILFASLRSLLINLTMLIRFDAESVTYIGPFRDVPQRYYRFQNLSTNQIDMRGSNMAVFANAMPKEKLCQFNTKAKEHFGFELESENHSGHICINIIQKGKSTNIVDNGFGYSQVMPVLLALHSFTYAGVHAPFSFGEDGQLMCIEQPELHLHPAMQYQLGQTFVDSVKYFKKKQESKKIMVETHSRSFIDEIGEAVADKQIEADDVAVYIFDGDADRVLIRLSEFDEEGFLKDWPLGFLD